ncbi:MAG: C40 family peptidase [Defluviitaleaceae bacterium]|nr:C40 family peptidase [Defluviitaleaceae bacterium]
MTKLSKLRYVFAVVLAFGLIVMARQVTYANTYVMVTGNVVNVRSQPEINDYNRITTVNQGERIRVVGEYGDFFRGDIPGIGYAYIAREWVRFYQANGTVTAPAVWIFDLPDTLYGEPISVAVEGDRFTVVSYYGNWYGIIYEGGLAYIGRPHIDVPSLIDVPPARSSSAINSYVQDDVIQRAMSLLGRPYRWGGNGPYSFDCSGFVIYVLRPFGVTLPRRSRDMVSSGVHVNRSDVQPGDLLFFATMGGGTVSHVGMYIGGGQLIHSSSSRSGGVIISNFHSDYYVRTFVTARRVL